jgi:hypothetical protein
MTEPIPAPEPAPYKDDDLVYVDPDTRTVIAKVEFGKNGNAKKFEVPVPAEPEKEGKDGKPRRRTNKSYYPWGSYRSMKKMYKIEGKQPKSEPNITLDEAIQKALEQPFW